MTPPEPLPLPPARASSEHSVSSPTRRLRRKEAEGIDDA